MRWHKVRLLFFPYLLAHRAQIHTVVEYNVFPDLILLCKNADVEIKREAIWAMCNSFAGGAPEDVRY